MSCRSYTESRIIRLLFLTRKRDCITFHFNTFLMKILVNQPYQFFKKSVFLQHE